MKPQPLQLTRDLLHYNTINPPGMERDCARHLGQLLEAAGFEVKYHEFAESRTSVVATIGGRQEKPPICFTGHIDIVPLGGAVWLRDPFAGETDGDRLYGRGSADDMGGWLSHLLAMEAWLAETGALPPLTEAIVDQMPAQGWLYVPDCTDEDLAKLELVRAAPVELPPAYTPCDGLNGSCFLPLGHDGDHL